MSRDAVTIKSILAQERLAKKACAAGGSGAHVEQMKLKHMMLSPAGWLIAGCREMRDAREAAKRATEWAIKKSAWAMENKVDPAVLPF